MNRDSSIPQAITVYGASSPQIDTIYKEAAYRLGSLIASMGLTLITGGGRSGIMAAAIEGAIEAGGKTIGVLPSFMIDRCWNHPGLSDVIVTDGMHERKQTMAAMSRAAIAMPGGCGTLEELMEIITWRQLGLYNGNVVIANINGFFDPLLSMLDRCITQRFMNPDHTGLWKVSYTPEQAVQLALYPIEERHFTQKISTDS